MKSMRKMVLAGMILLASVMVLVGCDTNAGGGDNEVSNTGTNAGGGGNEEPNPVPKPMLPESLGKDPFEGKTLLITKYNSFRLKVDTSNKTLVYQSRKPAENDSTSEPVYVYEDYIKWSYSYDNLTDTPTITLQYESFYDQNGKVLTIPETIDSMAELVSSFAVSGLALNLEFISKESDEEKKQEEIRKINEEYNLNLTKEDFTEEKIEATQEKVIKTPVAQKMIQEAGQEIKKHLEDLFSRLATYAITLEKTEKNEDKIGFEGKYDSNYEWYDQITGEFADSEGGRASFNWFSKYITVDGKDYSVTSITGDRIHCEREGETKTFSYEKSPIEPNSDMTITVTVGDESIPCIWVPGSIKDLSDFL